MISAYVMKPVFVPLGSRVDNEAVLDRVIGGIDRGRAREYMRATGTEVRHLDLEPVSIPATAAQVVAEALRRNGLTLDQLDGLIYGGLFRDHLEPCTAAFVALELGAPHLKVLDVTSACSGMAHGIEVAIGWLATNPSLTHVALVSVDTVHRAIDWHIDSDADLLTKGAGLTLGAGASALIVSRVRPELGIAVERFVSYDDASYAPVCHLAIGGRFSSDSNRLARPTAVSMLRVKQAGVAKNTWIVPHQPSVEVSRMARFFGTELERVIITHAQYGNTGASAWVSAYDHLVAQRFHEVRDGDPVLIKTMAGGFSSLGILGRLIKTDGAGGPA